MSTPFDINTIEDTIRFHGHFCPGLVIGIRAAEYCLEKLGHNNDIPIVAVTETDMCGVDAIQFLTGCTLGKGNLIHRDHGKSVFTFFRKDSEKGFRISLCPDSSSEEYLELRRLMGKERTDEEEQHLMELRDIVKQQILSAPLEQLFTEDTPLFPIPRGPQILESITCAMCDEPVMESRIRRYEGKHLCIPCLNKVEQKM